MEAFTRYCTTDLDLYSAEDLTALAATLELRGLHLARRLTRFTDGAWFCGFSMGGESYEEPEPNIAALLTVIEGLDPSSQAAWAGCSQRLFDIGYDCGLEPFVFRQELSADTLVRLAAAGATLRITLYSDPEVTPAAPPSGPGT